MKSNLRKSSLLLFCAIFFAFAFLASPGLAYTGPLSVDGTGTIKTYTSMDLDVQTTGKTSEDFNPDYRGVVAVNGGSVDITKELKVTTTGDNSNALNALNGGKIKAGSADITTSGNTAVAVYAQSAAAISSVDITGHARITTNGTANSVYANENGEISFGSLELTTASGDALQANGNGTNKGGVIRVSDYATVTTSGENAIGLFANLGGNISIGGLAKVTTSGKNAYGMQIGIGKESSISVGSADITTNGVSANGIDMHSGTVSVATAAVISTSGDAAAGIEVQGGSFKADSMKVKTQGSTARGIYSTGGGASVDITGLAKVTTSGDWSDGMYTTEGSVIKAGSADVTTSGAHSYGIFSGGTSDDLRSTVDITGLAKVTATTASVDSYGMWAKNKGIIKVGSAEISTNGVTGFGIASSNLASVDITGLAKVTTLGQYGQGLRAENGGAITAGSAEVTTSGDTAHGIWSWGISDDQRASVNIAGLANISTSSSDAHGLYAQDGGAITAGSADVTTRGSSSYGIWSYGVSGHYSSSVDIKGQAKVLTLGSTQYGLYAESGDITVGGLADVRVANGSNAVYAENGIIKLNGGASLDVTGDGTGSNYVNGIGAASNGNVSVSGDKAVIKATANGSKGNAYAVYTDGGSVSVDVTGNIEFTASAQNGSASAVNGSNITLKAGGQASFDVTGLSASGLYKDSGQNLTVDAAGGSNYKVTATSGDAYGIAASSTDLAYGKINNIVVSATGGNAYGLAAINHGTLSGDGANSIANVSVTENTASKNAYGVYAYNGSSVTGASIDKLTVDSAGDAYGVNVDRFTATVSSADLAVGAMSVSGDKAAFGVSATGGSVKLALSGGMSVESKNSRAYGIGAYSSSDVTFTGMQAMTVSGDKDGAFGINADNSTVSGDLTSMKVYSVGGDAGSKGISANSSDVKLAMNGDLTVFGKGPGAEGIQAQNSSDVTFTGMKAMTVSVDFSWMARGIYAVNNSTVSGDLTSMKVTASSSATGISAVSSSDVKLAMSGGMSVESKNGDAYGIAALDGGSVSGDVKNISVTASTADKSAYGVYAYGSGSGARLGAIDNITVNSVGYGYGLYADRSTDLSGAIKDITVNADKFASGVEADYNGKVELNNMTGNLRATAKDGPAVAIGAYFGGKVNVSMNGGDISTETTGTGNSDGITAQNNGSVAVTGVNNITSTGANAFGVYASDSSIDIAMTGDLVSKSDKTARALEAYGNSEVTISSDAAHDIAIDTSAVGNTVLAVNSGGVISFNNANVYNRGSAIADSIMASGDTDGNGTVNAYASKINGDVEQKGTSGNLAVNLAQSTLTGAVHAAGGASVGLALDNTSVWNVTGVSDTNGELANNGGTVKFYGNDGDEVSKYHTVTVDKLTGQDGVYEMHANIKENSCDQIIANTSDVTGTIKILSPEGKTGPYRKRMKPYLVIVKGDKKSDFRLEVAETGNSFYRYGPSNATEYGAWQFELASEDIDGSALANASGLATLAANGGGLGWYLRNTMQVSSTAMAVFDSLMAPTIGHLEEGALYSQLGDQDWIASGDRTHVWGYAVYSKFKYTGHVTTPLEGSIDGDNYAENKYYGLTGGIDKVVHECDKGTLRLGAMMGYGEGDLDMDNGDASDNSFHAGVYGVYRFNSGLYLAGIAKYNRYRTDVTARPIEGGSYEASYNQDGFGISALAGKRFDLRNSWYVEPQAELGWARIGSASYTINNSDVEIDSTNSVRGRLGFSLGRRVATETGKTLDFYVKASIIREFDGETDLTMSGDPFKADFGGTWGQYKLGINYWNNDNFMLHGALVYENGENYESPIGVELGLNWFTGPKPQKDEAETTITE